MFEQYIIDALVYVANGYVSFRYTEQILVAKYVERRAAMCRWTAIYALAQLTVAEIPKPFTPYDRLLGILPMLLILFALQHIFFERNLSRQFFAAVSFEAGWEILRFVVSPVAHAIFSLWSLLWTWFFEQEWVLNVLSAQEDLIGIMQGINRAVMFLVIGFCRALQIALLVLYLRLILRRFVGQTYELKFHDSLFLLLPCVTALCIDLTMRLMAFSLDNGAMMLVYDRTPATLVLLPLVSVLLLGLVVSSVILFQNLVQYQNEERKRVLLESSMSQMRREITEITDIYADIRGLRHDLRGHIANIIACVRAGKRGDELTDYLDRMTDTVARLDFADNTGNPITDVIVHQARLQARKKNIAFSANFLLDAGKKFDVYDVSVILNNALQNALEASEHTSGGRGIELRSYFKGSLFFIEVANDFVGELNLERDLPQTTKTDGECHGLGLGNIERTAQKYHGDIDIQVTDGSPYRRFNLTVMLYTDNT